MLKKLVAVLLCLISVMTHGQDLIVTPEGDSLKCTILSEVDGWVRFQYKDNKETIVRELRNVDLKSIVLGYYNNRPAENNKDATFIDNSINIYNRDFVRPTWNVGLKAGLGYRVFGIGNRFTPEQQVYHRTLRNGFAANLDIGYFFWNNISLGLLADLYEGKKKSFKDERTDHVKMQYVGPQVVYRKVLEGNRSAVVTGFGIGMHAYKNQGIENKLNFERTGTSIGWSGSVGFETQITSHAALTFKATCLVGKNYKLKNQLGKTSSLMPLSKENTEDLSRINLGIGIKFF
jgi:hypothetical protein